MLANLAALEPIVDTALRVAVGLLLVPHGLRLGLGWFPNTGMPPRTFRESVAAFDESGHRPGWFWARAVVFTELVCGPLLALGFLTRLMALPVAVFLIVACIERYRIGKWFWNTLGVEYTLLWAIAAIWVLIHGGGIYSLDYALGLGRP